MIQKSLIEQLEILYNIFISNKHFVVISIIATILLVLLGIFNRLSNKKIPKIATIIMYLGITLTLLIFYHNEIFIFFDYLINNIFILLFFPNIAVYALVIIIVNILMVKSILNKNRERVLKIINIFFFILFNIIFYLIIDNVISNKVNIYDGLSIYTNSNLMVLIQLSMYLFMLWLVILLIAKISKNILLPHKVESVVREPVNTYAFKPITKKLKAKPVISDIPEITPNTIVVTDEVKDNLKVNDKLENNMNITNTSSLYTDYIDIVPVKKKKLVMSNTNMNISTSINDNTNITEFKPQQTLLSNMDIIFGKPNTLSNIMQDVTKLKDDKNDREQIKKIYRQISLNSKDLSLNDYNYLIKTLKEIRNNN